MLGTRGGSPRVGAHAAGPGWTFGLRWTLATAAGLAAGVAAMFAGVGAATGRAGPLVFGAVLGGVLGLCCGVAQGLVLRRRLAGTTRWAAATAAGWVLFWAPNMAGWFGRGSGVAGKMAEGLGHGALFGVVLGGAQWLVLRGRVPGAARWVATSVVGWAVAAAAGDGLKAAVGGGGPIDIAAGVVIATGVTAAGMARLLRSTGTPPPPPARR